MRYNIVTDTDCNTDTHAQRVSIHFVDLKVIMWFLKDSAPTSLYATLSLALPSIPLHNDFIPPLKQPPLLPFPPQSELLPQTTVHTPCSKTSMHVLFLGAP